MENKNGNKNNNNNNGNYNNYNNYNANNYYGSYYIGPYCASDHKSIHLGIFFDQTCTSKADDSVYGDRMYGASLPYSASTSKALVETSDCISCISTSQNGNNNNKNNNNNNQQNYNNNQYYAQASEMCQQLYNQAAKCESGMSVTYPDTYGCDFINKVLPRLESASQSTVYGNSGSGKAAKVFAWLFGITSVIFGAYAYFLYRKIKRGAVQLSAQDQTLA
jgi:hypothetical protein